MDARSPVEPVQGYVAESTSAPARVAEASAAAALMPSVVQDPPSRLTPANIAKRIEALLKTIIEASAQDAQTRIAIIEPTHTIPADINQQQNASNSILPSLPADEASLKQRLASICQILSSNSETLTKDQWSKYIQDIQELAIKITGTYPDLREEYKRDVIKHIDRIENHLTKLLKKLQALQKEAESFCPKTLAADIGVVRQKVEAKKLAREEELKKYRLQNDAYLQVESYYESIAEQAGVILGELKDFPKDDKLVNPSLKLLAKPLSSIEQPPLPSSAQYTQSARPETVAQYDFFGYLIPQEQKKQKLSQFFEKLVKQLVPSQALPKHASLSVGDLIKQFNTAVNRVKARLIKFTEKEWKHEELLAELDFLRKSQDEKASVKRLMELAKKISLVLTGIIREYTKYPSAGIKKRLALVRQREMEVMKQCYRLKHKIFFENLLENGDFIDNEKDIVQDLIHELEEAHEALQRGSTFKERNAVKKSLQTKENQLLNMVSGRGRVFFEKFCTTGNIANYNNDTYVLALISSIDEIKNELNESYLFNNKLEQIQDKLKLLSSDKCTEGFETDILYLIAQCIVFRDPSTEDQKYKEPSVHIGTLMEFDDFFQKKQIEFELLNKILKDITADLQSVERTESFSYRCQLNIHLENENLASSTHDNGSYYFDLPLMPVCISFKEWLATPKVKSSISRNISGMFSATGSGLRCQPNLQIGTQSTPIVINMDSRMKKQIERLILDIRKITNEYYSNPMVNPPDDQAASATYSTHSMLDQQINAIIESYTILMSESIAYRQLYRTIANLTPFLQGIKLSYEKLAEKNSVDQTSQKKAFGLNKIFSRSTELEKNYRSQAEKCVAIFKLANEVATRLAEGLEKNQEAMLDFTYLVGSSNSGASRGENIELTGLPALNDSAAAASSGVAAAASAGTSVTLLSPITSTSLVQSLTPLVAKPKATLEILQEALTYFSELLKYKAFLEGSLKSWKNEASQKAQDIQSPEAKKLYLQTIKNDYQTKLAQCVKEGFDELVKQYSNRYLDMPNLGNSAEDAIQALQQKLGLKIDVAQASMLRLPQLSVDSPSSPSVTSNIDTSSSAFSSTVKMAQQMALSAGALFIDGSPRSRANRAPSAALDNDDLCLYTAPQFSFDTSRYAVKDIQGISHSSAAGSGTVSSSAQDPEQDPAPKPHL